MCSHPPKHTGSLRILVLFEERKIIKTEVVLDKHFLLNISQVQGLTLPYFFLKTEDIKDVFIWKVVTPWLNIVSSHTCWIQIATTKLSSNCNTFYNAYTVKS